MFLGLGADVGVQVLCLVAGLCVGVGADRFVRMFSSCCLDIFVSKHISSSCKHL